MTRVLRECVRHGHVGKVRVGSSTKKIWLCWTGMKGSGTEMFKHTRWVKHKGQAATPLLDWRIYSELKYYDVDAGVKKSKGPRAPWYEWSNLHCKDLLRPRRDGDPTLPKFRTLPDVLPNSDPWSYFAQMRSERRKEEYTNGKKRAIWQLIKESRPNHYWDLAAMCMAFMAIVGVIGAPDSVEEKGA